MRSSSIRSALCAAAATIAVVALGTEAKAVALAGCPSMVRPPPCIITDAGRIAGTVAELQHRRREIETALQTVREYTSVGSLLGKVGALPSGMTTGLMPNASAGFRPLGTGPRVTISEASNALSASLDQYPASVDGAAQARRDHQLRVRAAAGESYALALATNDKLARMSQEANRITEQMKSLDQQQTSNDIRATWAVNQAARRLMFDAFLALREVQASRLQLHAIRAAIPKAGYRGNVQVSDAPPAQPATAPSYGVDLANLANASNKLAALLSARQVTSSFTDGINGARETQAEYQQMVNAAQAAQRNVEAIAARDARKKGVSASTLLQIANATMQQLDRTTWDSPNKTEAAKAAAKAAEKALDKRVSGDVNDSWSDYLEQRAEAYKQEAFFRPINQDAIAMERDTIAALAAYEQSLGVRASDPNALNAAISQATAEVQALSQKLNGSPPDVLAKRDEILRSSGIAAAQQPLPAADPAGTPDWASIYATL